ncbi:MAG TPA: hypothetical protein VJQ79_10790, partial [Acidimicrobiia bacterium]|nr:hypothetical protein [Acidimicrobiia bacterium]
MIESRRFAEEEYSPFHPAGDRRAGASTLPASFESPFVDSTAPYEVEAFDTGEKEWEGEGPAELETDEAEDEVQGEEPEFAESEEEGPELREDEPYAPSVESSEYEGQLSVGEAEEESANDLGGPTYELDELLAWQDGAAAETDLSATEDEAFRDADVTPFGSEDEESETLDEQQRAIWTPPVLAAIIGGER